MDFLDHTIAAWQPHSERTLTRDDAREIAHNVMGFFRVLRDWAEEEKRSDKASLVMPPVEVSLQEIPKVSEREGAETALKTSNA
jgi:hypothetical protein